MPEDHLEKLKTDFKENVLSFLNPRISEHIHLGFSSGLSKFEVDLGNNFTSGTPYHPQNTRFVHFTSLRNLHSIINEHAIRLYSMKNVNDPLEYYYYSDDLQNYEKSPQVKDDTYIFSLCDVRVLEGDNILNLWRLYGEGGNGVAIEFEIEFIVHATFEENYFLAQVLYEKPKLEEFRIRLAEFEQRNNVKIDSTKLMRIPACFHKNPLYRVEEEVRLMFYSKSSQILARTFPEEKRPGFKFDFNARNEIVTYHRIGFNDEYPGFNLKVKRIQLGFRHTEEYFKDSFLTHFKRTFKYLILNEIWENEMPIIEQSPLTNIYR